MPGMAGMDMSSMFGGYGMQGMAGMNPSMMNMMMGMDFNGGYGNSWNNGQQLNGDFGASTGFYPGGGGYNQSHQGHVPQMSQHQQYPKNNFQNQNRFPGSQRGHGRGGFYNQGRGQYEQNFPQPPPNAPTGPKAAQAPQYNPDGSRPLPEGYGRRPSQASSTEPRPTTSGASHEQAATSRDNLASSEKPAAENDRIELTGNTDNALTQQSAGAASENTGPDAASEQAPELAVNNGDFQGQQTAESGSMHGYNGSQDYTSGEQMNGGTEYSQQMEYNNNVDTSNEHGMVQGQWQNSRGAFRGRGRGGFRGRGGWQYNETREFSQPIVEPKGVGVEGAPTGPKALREGKPNTGWSGIARGGAAIRGGRGGFANATPAAPGSSTSHDHREEKSASSAPVNAPPNLTIVRTTNDRGRSASRTASRSRSQSRSRSKSRRRSHRQRSVTPSESEHDRKKERRRHRSSRKREDVDETRVEEPKDRDERKSHDRPHEDSVDDKYRSSRRDNDRRRSHRDTSKDRRRHRHRSRSASPGKNGDVDHETRASGSVNGNDVDSDKKHHRDKYRDRSRDRDREKDRHREKDRDKKRSRRDRSRTPESDHEHRSSRRSRKEKERDKDRERDRSRQRDAPVSARSSQPQTPIEPEAEFKIQGRSKDRVKPPPTGPASMQPPTGPRNPVGTKAQIKKNLGNLITTLPPPTGPRGSASSSRRPSQPATPTSASASAAPTPVSAVDPYEEERKKAHAERLRKEELRRGGLTGGLTKKRSYSDALDEVVSAAPTGPKGDRKARGSRDDGGGRGKKSRRTSYKYEDDETDEQRAVRVEREREASRWN
jgi:hypothetical protein